MDYFAFYAPAILKHVTFAYFFVKNSCALVFLWVLSSKILLDAYLHWIFELLPRHHIIELYHMAHFQSPVIGNKPYVDKQQLRCQSSETFALIKNILSPEVYIM